MSLYHVTFFYLASGMEGTPYTKDFGMVEANSEEEAKEIIVLRDLPKDEMYGPDNKWSSRDFLRGCLKAEKYGTP